MVVDPRRSMLLGHHRDDVANIGPQGERGLTCLGRRSEQDGWNEVRIDSWESRQEVPIRRIPGGNPATFTLLRHFVRCLDDGDRGASDDPPGCSVHDLHRRLTESQGIAPQEEPHGVLGALP